MAGMTRVRLAARALPLLAALAALLPGGARGDAASATFERVAVVVGANHGLPTDEPLRFAESDARRVHELLVQLGDVRADRASLVTARSAEQLRRALDEARGRILEIRAAGRRVLFAFYYSGHGDDGALHLPSGRVPLEELRRELGRLPADVRVAFLDACRTGGASKGVRRGPAFALARAGDPLAGSVEVRAASAGEAAQESALLGGALFTHHLLSALRGAGDRDGDGRVTLDEAYAYCYRQTLLRSGLTPVTQHASITASLTGAGELVLSRPEAAAAALEIEGVGRHLVFALPAAAVMGEADGGGRQRFALPPGRYVVERRRGDRVAVAEIDLSWGGRRALRDEDFTAVAPDAWALRGGRLALRTRRLALGGGLEAGLASAAERTGPRATLALAAVRGAGELALEAGWSGAAVATTGLVGREDEAVVALMAGWRLPLWGATLVAALGAEGRRGRLRLDRPDRARAAGFADRERRAIWSGGPRVALRVDLSLGHHLVAQLGAHVAAAIRAEQAAVDASARTVVRPRAGVVAGIGYLF